MITFNFERRAITAILFLGTALSLIQFLYNRNLWLDEAYLSLNIIHKSHYQLLLPLDYRQVAPILFLQIEKTFSLLFPNSDFGLRIFPQITFLLSLLVFYKLLKLIHQNYYTLIFSLSLFALNLTMIYYASEIKQYMSDVLVCLTCFYFSLKHYGNYRNKYQILGSIGVISIFLSNVSPIILATVGVYLHFTTHKHHRHCFRYLILIELLWIATFATYYFSFIKDHPSRDGLIQEWTYYRAFMPLNVFGKDFFSFLCAKWWVIAVTLFAFGKYGGMALSILTPIGIVALIKNCKNGIIILVSMPLVLHLFMSGLRLYPFELRLILYTAPCIIIIASYGFDYLLKVVRDYVDVDRFEIVAVCLPFMLLLSVYLQGFPIQKNEIRKSITFIQSNMESTDRVYVNYLTRIPFQYYQDTSAAKFDRGNIIIGENTVLWNGTTWAADTAIYSKELNGLKGRTWFIFDDVGDEREKSEFLIRYFKDRAKGPIAEFHAIGSHAYLFDL